MSLLRHTAWIDGRTGELLRDPGGTPNAPAVAALSYVYAPAPLSGLEESPDGAQLVIDSHLELGAFRLERGMSAREHGYAYTQPELKAAFAHPRVTRERIVDGIDPPERGRRLALYDAVAWWIAHIDRQWNGHPPPEHAWREETNEAFRATAERGTAAPGSRITRSRAPAGRAKDAQPGPLSRTRKGFAPREPRFLRDRAHTVNNLRAFRASGPRLGRRSSRRRPANRASQGAPMMMKSEGGPVLMWGRSLRG